MAFPASANQPLETVLPAQSLLLYMCSPRCVGDLWSFPTEDGSYYAERAPSRHIVAMAAHLLLALN